MPIDKPLIEKTLATPMGEQAYLIAEKLHDGGHDTWWVGGCVRDMLQGNMPKEIDIATSALPDDVMTVISGRWSVARFDETGKQYGSIIATMGKHSFEVTTFREDDEASDGRHPESVVFGTREKDATRRDITINAIYWNPISRELYDPFGGEADLKESLIRFIGEPGIRIKHDALRMLRAVRFRALIDGQYHPDTFAALREQARLIEILSGTRRLQEIEKMLTGPRPERAFEDLWELGILTYLIPELHACKGVPQPADYHREGDVWDHMMKILQNFREEDSVDVRIAALFHDCGKVETFSLKERIRFDEHASVSADLAAKALDRLQCPARRRDKICWVIRHHMMMSAFADMNDERKAHWYHHPWFTDLLSLFWLDIAGTEPTDFHLYDEINADYHKFLDSHPRPEKPLLTGDEVMDILGLKPGERVGEILTALHQAQIRKEITTKKEAREFVEKMKG